MPEGPKVLIQDAYRLSLVQSSSDRVRVVIYIQNKHGHASVWSPPPKKTACAIEVDYAR